MKSGYTCPYCGSMVDKEIFELHKKYCLYRSPNVYDKR